MVRDAFVGQTSSFPLQDQQSLEAMCSGKVHSRVGELASLRTTTLFLKDAHRLLFSMSEWDLTVGDCRSVRYRHLAFAMISRALCGVRANMHEPNRGFPARLFLLLDPEQWAAVAEEIRSGPECLLDPFTLKYKAMFPDQLLHFRKRGDDEQPRPEIPAHATSRQGRTLKDLAGSDPGTDPTQSELALETDTWLVFLSLRAGFGLLVGRSSCGGGAVVEGPALRRQLGLFDCHRDSA